MMGIMGDSGTNSTLSFQTKTGNQTHNDSSGGFMALNQGYLKQITLEIYIDLACLGFNLNLEVSGWGLPLNNSNDVGLQFPIICLGLGLQLKILSREILFHIH
jgi:hypothetical protein